MVSKVLSGVLSGVTGHLVEVEADISKGLPMFDIVGLPGSSVREARERVRSAIQNSGLSMPNKRITVNLAPGDMRKEGPSFDLPIAVALLVASGIIEHEGTTDIFITGELSLDGTIRPVDGVLAMVSELPKIGIRHCIVPFENAEEAALVDGLEVIGPRFLIELISHLCGDTPLPSAPRSGLLRQKPKPLANLQDVRGQAVAKRALEIAASGGHNMLMVGPPGSGKSMLARCLPAILPEPSFEEAIEITKIHSVAGLMKGRTMLTERPFCAPHHSISYAALVGGGRIVRPGEISLAHGGVLFLDELPEFARNTLEMLRQPIESGDITIHRAGSSSVTYPASFMLLAAMNPCPCGFYGDGSDRCSCSQAEIARYLGKVSGPLLDRIDIHIEVSPLDYSRMAAPPAGETSEEVAARVEKAGLVARKRYGTTIRNAQLTPEQVDMFCRLGDEENNMLRLAFENMRLSARAYHKVLKVARTIADLGGKEHIDISCIAEALQYRSLDRKYWA